MPAQGVVVGGGVGGWVGWGMRGWARLQGTQHRARSCTGSSRHLAHRRGPISRPAQAFPASGDDVSRGVLKAPPTPPHPPHTPHHPTHPHPPPPPHTPPHTTHTPHHPFSYPPPQHSRQSCRMRTRLHVAPALSPLLTMCTVLAASAPPCEGRSSGRRGGLRGREGERGRGSWREGRRGAAPSASGERTGREATS